MCSTLFDNREKNEDLEGNHCVIVFAAADLLRPLAAKLWFSLLGDTGLLTKVTKSHNKHKNKAIGEKLHQITHCCHIADEQTSLF